MKQKTIKITTCSSKETKKLAQYLAKKVQPGQIIGLKGDLGAGKTNFVQGFAQALGIEKNITSPTFVLIKQYNMNYN